MIYSQLSSTGAVVASGSTTGSSSGGSVGSGKTSIYMGVFWNGSTSFPTSPQQMVEVLVNSANSIASINSVYAATSSGTLTACTLYGNGSTLGNPVTMQVYINGNSVACSATGSLAAPQNNPNTFSAVGKASGTISFNAGDLISTWISSTSSSVNQSFLGYIEVILGT